MSEAKTVRLFNSESGSVVVVDEETASRLGPEWTTDQKKDRPSARTNTNGVAPKVDLSAQDEETPTPAKKSASSKSGK